jgi:hypothetical protein
MIDVATLSDLQKQKLQRILEINKPITYGIISVSIGHDPCNVYGRFSHMLKQRPYVSACIRVCVCRSAQFIAEFVCLHGQNMASSTGATRTETIRYCWICI